MQDMPLAVHYTHRPGTEYTGFFYQAPCHNAMSGQQIVHRIGIKFIEPLINLIGIFDFGNILWGCQDMLPIQYGRYLLQGKGVLLNGQGTMDGADAIGTAQRRTCRQGREYSQTPHQLGDLRHIVNDLVCDFKGRFLVSHIAPRWVNRHFYYTTHRSFHQSKVQGHDKPTLKEHPRKIKLHFIFLGCSFGPVIYVEYLSKVRSHGKGQTNSSGLGGGERFEPMHRSYSQTDFESDRLCPL